jgi:hypothetical protein
MHLHQSNPATHAASVAPILVTEPTLKVILLAPYHQPIYQQEQDWKEEQEPDHIHKHRNPKVKKKHG